MSAVGVVVLVTLILLLQLVSQMSASPPSPTTNVQELRERIASLQKILTEIQDSIAVLHRAREQSEIFTPSQDHTDALQSTVERLEANVAQTEKQIEEIKERIAQLQNNPAIQQLEATQEEIDKLSDRLDDLKQQTKDTTENFAELEEKVRELRAKNTALDQQLAQRAVPQLRITVPKDTDRTAFILDYGQGVINVIPVDGSPTQRFSTRSQFDAWIRGRNPVTEHFVVYVRPSRFGEHEAIVRSLRARGFDVGLQVIGEKTNLSLND